MIKNVTTEDKKMGSFHKSFSKVDLSETPVKFHPMKDELLPFLLQNLHNFCLLEEEIYDRDEQLSNENKSTDKLWNEYKRHYTKLAKPICTEDMLKRLSLVSYGKPSRYGYLNTGCDKVIFKMKSQNKAVVEIHFQKGVGERHQFVLQKKEDGWKISDKNIGFASEKNKWHKCEL